MKRYIALTPSQARSRARRLGGMSLLLVSVTSFAQLQGKSTAERATSGAREANQAMLGQATTWSPYTAELVAAVRQINPGGWRMKVGSGTTVAMDDSDEMGGMAAGAGGDRVAVPDSASGGMPPGDGTSEWRPNGSGGMKDDQMSDGATDGVGAPSVGGAMPAKGGCCMGEMGAMGATQPGGMGGLLKPSSATPGYAGSSHLYHIGSTGFFLDHPERITLAPDQSMALYHIKEKALLDRRTQQRGIDQAEQDLYTLTGLDQPDEAAIQAKIAEIEKLRGDQRMNFIQAVGQAANALTHDQHRALLGISVTPKQP